MNIHKPTDPAGATTPFPQHEWKDSSASPPINVDQVRQYVRGQLADPDSWEVAQLTSQFKPWHDAEMNALAELAGE